MILEKALKLYTNFLKNKGSSELTQKKYFNQIFKMFKFNKKTDENRNSITYKEIDKYIKKQKRTQNTKATEVAQIKSFIKFCNIEKLIELNSNGIILPKKEFKEANFLKNNELNKILKKIENKNLKIKTAIYLLITTGGRISEICNITKKQIENAIFINGNYQISIIGKGKRVRPLFIPPRTYNLCLKNKNFHKEKNIIGFSAQKLSREIRKLKKEIKINFTAHTFRHTFITELAKSGISLYHIQKLAGHSNINTTATYLHACNNELATAVNKLEYRI